MKSTLLILIFVYLLSLAQGDNQTICRGLALQGGSDRGAYQAGVLQGLLQALGSDEIAYDVVSGVTIGAINAAWMSQFPKGQEESMIDEMVSFWLALQASDIYKNWEGGILQGLLLEPSIYNTEPGMQYLKSHITQPPQRYMAVGTANANTANFKVFHNFVTNFEVEDLLNVVMASNGIPAVFPYMNINGSTYFDGSILKSMDIASVVNQCRQLNGGVDENIIVDLVMLENKTFSGSEKKNPNALGMLRKTMELTSYHNALISVIRAHQTFPNIQFRYVVAPSKPLPSSELPLSFNHNDIVSMIEQGTKDAISTVQKGAGISFEEIVDYAKSITNGRYGIPNSGSMLKKYFSQVNEVLAELKNSKKLDKLEV